MRSPAAMGTPATSMSAVAVRKKLLSGVTQRISSSTAAGTRVGSAAMASHWSGWSASAARPREMTVRVVSAPPEMTRPVSFTSIWAVYGQPAASACAHTDTRSSRGSALRAASVGKSSAENSPMASMKPWAASRSVSAWSYRMSRSDQVWMSGQRSSGKPSRWAVSRAGSGAASSVTTSTRSASAMPSMSSAMRALRYGSSWRTAFGVKRRATSLRWSPCWGSSSEIMLSSPSAKNER